MTDSPINFVDVGTTRYTTFMKCARGHHVMYMTTTNEFIDSASVRLDEIIDENRFAAAAAVWLKCYVRPVLYNVFNKVERKRWNPLDLFPCDVSVFEAGVQWQVKNS